MSRTSFVILAAMTLAAASSKIPQTADNPPPRRSGPPGAVGGVPRWRTGNSNASRGILERFKVLTVAAAVTSTPARRDQKPGGPQKPPPTTPPPRRLDLSVLRLMSGRLVCFIAPEPPYLLTAQFARMQGAMAQMTVTATSIVPRANPVFPAGPSSLLDQLYAYRGGSPSLGQYLASSPGRQALYDFVPYTYTVWLTNPPAGLRPGVRFHIPCLPIPAKHRGEPLFDAGVKFLGDPQDHPEMIVIQGSRLGTRRLVTPLDRQRFEEQKARALAEFALAQSNRLDHPSPEASAPAR